MFLGLKSKMNLRGVHPDLVRVVEEAIGQSALDFTVTEGVRTLARQRELCECGASKTMKSRHLTGHAVDIAPIVNGQVRWDWPLFDILAVGMKNAATKLDIPLEWGGDWVSFKDGPHFQLPWKDYP